MGHVVSATEARIRFGELMRRAVESRETIIVERGGKSHVVVISIDEYERLLREQQGKDWKGLVAQARAQIQTELGDRDLPPAEEIVRQVREERDAQLLAVR
ncbi:MAG: type II toxin-antitoxin system Phd/YefM family antitoxin [Chloroflexi bacterium]|nr:type II toxin-antitoxin system Phd/YefM family antitoxin [Chloroflexota bacterium]